MMNPKLLVFIVAFAVCAILPSADADDMGITVNLSPESLGGSVNAEKIKATLNFPAEMFDGPVDDSTPNDERKLICFGKMRRLLAAYSQLEKITEADFKTLCKNVTEIEDCFSKADFHDHFEHNTLFGLIHDYYTCSRPYFKTAYNFCQLTFDDAGHTQQCFEAAIKHYSGSPEETECREICCPDTSTLDAVDPIKCAPEGSINDGWARPCEEPVLNGALISNECLKACLSKAWSRFAKHACGAEAARIVKVYGKEMHKKFTTARQCFEMCPKA